MSATDTEALELPAPDGPVDLSVVIPAYDEEHRLGPTLDAVTRYLSANRGHWGSWEIVVADDGSTDGTRDVVSAYVSAHVSAHTDARIRLISSPRNRGKGNALRIGVAASRGRRVLVTDADLAAPIEELEKLDKALSEGNSAAIGSRRLASALTTRAIAWWAPDVTWTSSASVTTPRSVCMSAIAARSAGSPSGWKPGPAPHASRSARSARPAVVLIAPSGGEAMSSAARAVVTASRVGATPQ